MSCECYLNELLAYISHYINNSTVVNIKKIVIDFYSNDEIIIAKQLLWQLCSDDLVNYKERRSTEKRTNVEANVEDIIDAFKEMDVLGKLPQFAAVNIDRLPNKCPEELNMISILSRLKSLEGNVDSQLKLITTHENEIQKLKSINLKLEVDNIRTDIDQYKKDLDDFKSNFASNDRIKNEHDNSKEIINDNMNDESEWDTLIEDFIENELPSKNGYTSRILPKIEKLYNRPMKKRSKRNTPKKKTTRKIEKVHKFNENLDSESFSDDSTQSSDVKDFHLVETKAQKRRRLVSSGIRKNVLFRGPPTPDLKHIFIYRVQDGDTNSIRKYIQSKHVKVYNIEQVSHINSKYKSFKLSVSSQDINTVMDGSFWPYNVKYKFWYDRNNKVKQNNLFYNSKFIDKTNN